MTNIKTHSPQYSRERGRVFNSMLLMSFSMYFAILGHYNWVKWTKILPQPILIFLQHCAEERRNKFGILRGESRWLQCCHSLRRESRWIDFLLWWCVVQNQQRRDFLIKVCVTNANSLGQKSGTELFPLENAWTSLRAVTLLSIYRSKWLNSALCDLG